MSFFCWDETNTKCSIKEDRRKIFQGEGHIYEGLSVNSCSVDVSAIKNALFEKYAEAATKGVLWKKVFLEISQNSLEKTCAFVKLLGVQLY